jgi:hypothetical protein
MHEQVCNIRLINVQLSQQTWLSAGVVVDSQNEALHATSVVLTE